MTTFTKTVLSGSTNGKAINVGATGATGATIHTAVALQFVLQKKKSLSGCGSLQLPKGNEVSSGRLIRVVQELKRVNGRYLIIRTILPTG